MEGTAAGSEDLHIEALPSLNSSAMCKSSDVVNAKVALSNGIFDALPLLSETSKRRIRKLETLGKTIIAQISAVPEVFLSCTKACVRADIGKSIAVLKANVKRVQVAVEGALAAQQKAKKRNPALARNLKSVLKVLRTEPARFPRVTYLCSGAG
jgi:hypothetical protein